MEYKEDHLIRRAATERIIKRRLMLNPEGVDEAENIIRELLWARYFPSDSLSILDVRNVQSIINKYLTARRSLLVGRPEKTKIYLSQFIMDLLTCEIEETLSPQESTKDSIYTYFIYQVLRKKIKIEDIDTALQDAYFYVAVEKGFAKSDLPYLRYHLFKLTHKPLGKYEEQGIKDLTPHLPATFNKIDRIIDNPYSEKLVRFIRKQTPPFLVLYELLERYPGKAYQILQNRNILVNNVDLICREKYQQTTKRLQTTAIRSLIYIFLTKMVFQSIPTPAKSRTTDQPRRQKPLM